MSKKFAGQFDALTKQGQGASYCNYQRFRPLSGRGKPLWEFKEHDHRLYCFRRVGQQNTTVVLVLFNGWAKQKTGKTKKEHREIECAMEVYAEFMNEFPGGNI
jgi:hypothetical protein